MYARAGAARGERVVYYGFEETKPMLLRNFATIGLPMEALEDGGTLRVVCRYPEALSLEDLLVDLRLGLEEFAPSLIVLDSISSIEHASSERALRQFMIGIASLFREHGRSALITQTVATQSEAHQAAPFLSTIADAILTVDYDAGAADLERTIRVLKMRGSAHETKQRTLRIQRGGIAVDGDIPAVPGDDEQI
jgi:circadian clock protein KaiC